MEEKFNKRYSPEDIEEKWYKWWEENNLFKPQGDGEPFTIVIPPPNVTGVLTLGHVLDNTLQDILIRRARMQGKRTLWLPGTDHAGLATQVVVEKHIKKEGKTKESLGRDMFIPLVWDWAKKHRERIINQLKKMGASLDWSRERFTLDKGLSKAVKKVFIELYNKKLIYKGKYIVNWCPRCHTALSDEQVTHKEKKGYLYYIKYPLKNNEGFITVATTRPETMVGDTAVAVNPADERYKKYIGKKLILPLMNREIPVITDDIVEKDFGTGAVKVTPYHDLNDFNIARRHGIDGILIINDKGFMTEEAGPIAGLERFKAREKIVELLKDKGFLEKIEDYNVSVGTCERCNTVIEPYLSDQWFVKMKPLAEKAKKVVEDNTIRFYPERWKNLYFHWLDNIQDWCISRQVWWGHRIPVFTCRTCKHTFVSEEDKPACPECGAENPVQDPDVLDTWFSSWLWPFSTMGWPEKTEDLKTFYPTDILITGWDIIYLWVARMIMAGLEFTNTPPFKNVLFHTMIRDEKGRKMSKSLGNSPDTIELMKKYGADALRFGLLLITPREQDVIYSEERIKTGRNFANKLWNAARLVHNLYPESNIINEPADKIDSFILNKFNETLMRIEEYYKTFELTQIAQRLYQFFWHDFCDWYLELIKIRKNKLTNQHPGVSHYILKEFLKLLHPFMPFITEEIWHKMGYSTGSIMYASWPKPTRETKEEYDLNLFKAYVQSIRNIKSSLNIPLTKKLSINLKDAVDKELQPYLNALCNVNIDPMLDKGIRLPIRDKELIIGISNIDITNEKKRMEKEATNLEKIIIAKKKKLSNKGFLEHAKQEIIEKEKAKLKELEDKLNNIKRIFNAL